MYVYKYLLTITRMYAIIMYMENKQKHPLYFSSVENNLSQFVVFQDGQPYDDGYESVEAQARREAMLYLGREALRLPVRGMVALGKAVIDSVGN